MYLDMAELASAEQGEEARNVAAGNAVLAAIAASDAICCVRLGRRYRGQDHQGAAALLRKVASGGTQFSKDLANVLGVKDSAHYGEYFVGDGQLKSTLRCASRLVEAAETIVTTG
jgi:hypothetical protein